MSINKLPTIKGYWEGGQFIGNDGIRNVMTRSRFKDILRNLHFSDNIKEKKVIKVIKSDPLSTILTRVLIILFQMIIFIWWNSKVNQAWNNMSKTS